MTKCEVAGTHMVKKITAQETPDTEIWEKCIPCLLLSH